MTTKRRPCKGEIWGVRFDPNEGDEIGKTRPAVVISEDSVGIFELKIVVPITGWQEKHSSKPWFTKIQKNTSNGLSKDSGADGFQVKSLSIGRFTDKIGSVSASQLTNIIDSVALCIGVEVF